MKIKSIKLTNHKILGDLSLDFTNESGKIADTIIFAGENGTGKSIILDLIFQFSSFSYNSQEEENFGTGEFIVELSDKEIDLLKSPQGLNEIRNDGINTHEMSFKLDPSFGSYFSQIKVFWKDASNITQQINGGAFTNAGVRKIFKPIFSDAEINFSSGRIEAITTKDIDQEFDGGRRSSIELAKEITQLLVDIQTQDAIEFRDWTQNNLGKPVDISLLDSRMKRFKEAFSFMFPGKQVKRLINERHSKKLIFEEFGKEIPIDGLSSGEKQIVFRGGFLLKDQKNNLDSIVLIDEPEISLHPLWQLKILNFYKKLFTNDLGKQTSQIFVATHSPFIVHNDTRRNDKVIVLKRNEKGKVIVSQKSTFFYWGPEETIKDAFNIDWGSNTKPIVLVEGKYDERYIQKAAELHGETDLLLHIELKNRDGTGNLDNTWNHYADIIKRKIILLYDCETDRPNSQKGQIYKRTIPLLPENPIKKGIENLFPFETIKRAIEVNPIFIDVFPEAENTIHGVKEKKPITYMVNKSEKGNFCNWLCQNGTREDFENFKKIFEIIRGIITT